MMPPRLVVFIKGRKDGKVAVKKTVTRKGSTFQQTFWVSPAEAAALKKQQAAPKKTAPKVPTKTTPAKSPETSDWGGRVDRLLRDAAVPNAAAFKVVILSNVTTEVELEETIVAFKRMFLDIHVGEGIVRKKDIAIELLKGKKEFYNFYELDAYADKAFNTLIGFEKSGNFIEVEDYFEWIRKHNVAPIISPDIFSISAEDDFGEDIDGFELMNYAIMEDISIEKASRTRRSDVSDMRDLLIDMYESYLGKPLKDRLDVLRKGPISRTRKFPGRSLNAVFRVTKGEKVKVDAVWKPKAGEKKGRESVPTGTYYLREALAYELCVTIGSDLIPPTVVTEVDGEPGSVQEFQYNHKQASDLPPSERGVDEDVAMEMSVIDYLLGNTDRHDGNYLIQEETGHVALIDHGLCFPDNFLEFRPNGDLYRSGKTIPSELLVRLENADWNSFFEKMEKSGLSEDAINGFSERFDRILGDGRVPSYAQIREYQNWERALIARW